jgi:sulfur-carrier protein adenylyltransferase/sulfurtransferase
MSIKDVTAEELRRFVRTQHEKDFELIDVRQPEEYRRGHIPGARLLPVSQLVQSLDRLPADKTLVFYCHAGGRSMAAAVMADEQAAGRSTILNLNGGMLAWDGARLADVPRVRLFDGGAGAQAFETAMAMEKGAQLFYESLAADLTGQPGGEVFARLAKAETAHARTVYGFWQKRQDDLAPFEALFARHNGEILEGGMSLKDVLQKAAGQPEAGQPEAGQPEAGQAEDRLLRLIETALQIEYAAYDLYRTMAARDGDEALRETFYALAQAEKSHMQALIAVLA